MIFSRKYYVNNIDFNDINVAQGQHVIGLYRGGVWKGVGHFSGWYSAEYMRGAVLLGYFIIESSLTIEKGRNHIEEVVLARPKRYRRLHIDSLYTQKKIHARNDREASALFFSEKWNDILMY